MSKQPTSHALPVPSPQEPVIEKSVATKTKVHRWYGRGLFLALLAILLYDLSPVVTLKARYDKYLNIARPGRDWKTVEAELTRRGYIISPHAHPSGPIVTMGRKSLIYEQILNFAFKLHPDPAYPAGVHLWLLENVGRQNGLVEYDASGLITEAYWQ